MKTEKEILEQSAIRAEARSILRSDQAVGDAYYRLNHSGNHMEAAALLISHIISRPIYQNPQTYADIGKPITE